MENDVELKSTSTTTVPRSGSIILASFETDQRRSAVLNISASNGKSIPFAAEVYQDEIMIGSMGQGGQSFVRGINDSGELIIRWFENNKTINCKLNYQLPVRPETLGSIDTLLLKILSAKWLTNNMEVYEKNHNNLHVNWLGVSHNQFCDGY